MALFGKSKPSSQDLVLSGPSGGRSAGTGGQQAPPDDNDVKPPQMKNDFFQSQAWTNHFLDWATMQSNDQSAITPGVVKAFQNYQKAFPNTQDITREEAIKFCEETLRPLQGDPQVAKLVNGYSNQFSLQTMLDTLKDDQAFSQRGQKVMADFGTKLGYHLQSEYAQYRDLLDHKSPTLPPLPLPDAPEVPKFSGLELPMDAINSTMAHVQGLAQEKIEETTQTAKQKLGEIGVPEDAQEATLKQMGSYLAQAPLTINFNPSAKEVSLYENVGGRTPIWAAPKAVVDGQNPGYLNKRKEVEEKFFNLKGNPSDNPDPSSYDAWSDRPVYASVNVGNAVTGASNEWGKCYFELKDSVKERTTYSQKDTFSGDNGTDRIEHIGTAESMEGVVADMSPDKLKEIHSFMTGEKAARGLGGGAYVEAHIHGMVDFGRDVEKLVIDRAQVPEGSKLDKQLMRMAKNFGIKVEAYDYGQWNKVALEEGIAAANEKEAPKVIYTPEAKQVDLKGPQAGHSPSQAQVQPPKNTAPSLNNVLSEGNSPPSADQKLQPRVDAQSPGRRPPPVPPRNQNLQSQVEAQQPANRPPPVPPRNKAASPGPTPPSPEALQQPAAREPSVRERLQMGNHRTLAKQSELTAQLPVPATEQPGLAPNQDVDVGAIDLDNKPQQGNAKRLAAMFEQMSQPQQPSRVAPAVPPRKPSQAPDKAVDKGSVANQAGITWKPGLKPSPVDKQGQGHGI